MSWFDDASSERMMTPDQVVIGEAVAVEVTPATAVMRILSGLIDYCVYGICFLLTMACISLFPSMSPTLSMARYNITISIVLFCWIIVIPLTVEVLSRGRSAGRLVTGGRVVRDDGGAVLFRHSVVRVLVSSVEVWLCCGLLAAGMSLLNKRGKRLGDVLAGTYVIRVRPGAAQAPPLLMPPELSSWASQADMRALPGDLALAARTFLQRAASMAPEPRAQMAMALASRISLYVTAPPPQTHPERFLAAVLCERRDREWAVAQRDRAQEEKEMTRSTALSYGVPQASSVFSPRSTRR